MGKDKGAHGESVSASVRLRSLQKERAICSVVQKAEITPGIAFSLVAPIRSVKHLRRKFEVLLVRVFPNLVPAAQRNVEGLHTVAMMLVMHAAHPAFSTLFPRRKRIVSSIAVILLAACWLAAQSQKPAASQTKSRLASAIDRTLDQGHDAILPPHVSNLLGISPEQHEVPVKQFVQMGEPVRGFEISTAEHNNVVIFVESSAQKKSTFYLTSRRGTLRKVLSVIEGVGYARVPTKPDRETFEQEKQRWIDALAP